MRTFARLSATVGLAAATALATAGVATSAFADPVHAPSATSFGVDCQDGSHYDVVGNGNGSWTPVHDLASNAVLIPVGFSGTHAVAYDEQGNVVGQYDDDSVQTKAPGAQKTRSPKTCTFDTGLFVVDHQDPDVPAAYTERITGGVTLAVAGSN